MKIARRQLRKLISEAIANEVETTLPSPQEVISSISELVDKEDIVKLYDLYSTNDPESIASADNLLSILYSMVGDPLPDDYTNQYFYQEAFKPTIDALPQIFNTPYGSDVALPDPAFTEHFKMIPYANDIRDYYVTFFIDTFEDAYDERPNEVAILDPETFVDNIKTYLSFFDVSDREENPFSIWFLRVAEMYLNQETIDPDGPHYGAVVEKLLQQAKELNIKPDDYYELYPGIRSLSEKGRVGFILRDMYLGDQGQVFRYLKNQMDNELTTIVRGLIQGETIEYAKIEPMLRALQSLAVSEEEV